MRVQIGIKRYPLPELISHLDQTAPRASASLPPERMSHVVSRMLRVGEHRARCLVTALVLYRLLAEQDERSEVIIGLPQSPDSKDAHAWVELNGREIGPSPRDDHLEMARYG